MYSCKLKLFFVVIGLLLVSSVFSQKENENTPTEVFLSVLDTYSRNDSLFAEIKGGARMGVMHGLVAKCFQSPRKRPDGREGKFSEVGSGLITATGLDGSECFIQLYNPSKSIEAGDLISLQLKLPPVAYKGVFYELGLVNVEFTNREGESLYSLQDILEQNSPEKEKQTREAILAEFRSTYERYKSNTNLSKAILKKIDDGRFKGKVAFDMLRDATLADLNSFLTYLTTYPDGYRGMNFWISESFMGWIVSNAPYSYPEVKAALYPIYRNKELLQKKIVPYKADIIKEKACQSFAVEASNFSDNRQFDSAYKMIDFAMTIANAVNDTFGKAAVYLLKAQVDQDLEKYADAIKECDNGLKYSRLFKNANDTSRYMEFKENEARLLIKKGFCQYKISLYKEANRTLEEARLHLENNKTVLGESLYAGLLVKREEYVAMINYNDGNYVAALSSINTAISINDQVNSTDSRARNAYNYWLKGKIYNQQKNSADALSAFSQSKSIYAGRNDEQNMAIVLNEVAYTYYNLAEYRKSIACLDTAFQQLSDLKDSSSAGYSKSLMGNCFWELGKYDSAINAHQQAISLRRSNESGLAYSWEQLGSLYKLSGLKDKAMDAYKEALRHTRNVGDSTGVAGIFKELGILYHNDEFYSMAVSFYERAAKITPEVPTYALYNLGNAWSYLDSAKAKFYFKECERVSERYNDNAYLFNAQVALASMAYRYNDLVTGDRYYQKVVNLAKVLETPSAEAERLSLKAFAYTARLEPDSAIAYYDMALKIQDTVSKDDYIWGLLRKAGVHTSKGEFSTADSLYRTAGLLATVNSRQRALGISLTSSSFLFAQLGEFSKGIQANDSAAAIFRSTGNYYQLANTYVDRGSIYKAKGDHKQSIYYYQLADSIYLAQKTEENRGTIFNNIGVTYYNQGDYKKAIEYFNRSAKYIKADFLSESYLLNRSNLAECYYYLKETSLAKKLMLETFARSGSMKRIATGMAIVLGQISFDANKLDSAAYWLHLARQYSFASSQKEAMMKSLVWLGKVETARGNTAAAFSMLSEAANLAKKYDMFSQGWESLYELGLYYYQQGKPDSAIVQFKEAVEMVERNTANLYGGEEAGKLYKKDPRKFDLYSKLIALLGETNQVDEAWAYANRSNITGLKEMVGGAPLRSGNPEKDEDIKQGTQLLQQQNTLDNNIRQILSKPEAEQNKEVLQGYYAEREIVGAKYLKFITELKKRDDDLASYFSQNVDPAEFKNYRGILPPDMAVLLYVINDNKVLTFVLTNEKLSIQISEANKDINGTISRFTTILKNRAAGTGTSKLVLRSELDEDPPIAVKGTFKEYADSLYDVLFAKVAPLVSGKHKLCIIPNGDLSKVPFQAIGRTMKDSSFRFLAEDYAIFYTNKIDILKDPPAPMEDIASFAVFGVPDKTLRYTQKEAEAIGSIIKTANAVYTGNLATEKLAKTSLSGKKFVHFATHGILDYSEYSRSYLKFLPDKDTSNGNNGKLTMDEIEELDIEGCDLVTLSACETAVGKQLRPGWQISPANSFISNRVRSVVATLWKVDDEATSILMDEFYLQLMKGTGKAEALRIAQQKLSANPKYTHPFFWAPFVLYGDWR